MRPDLIPEPDRPVPYSLTPRAEAALAGPEPGFAYVHYQPTPYDLGITDDPGACWPELVNGIRPAPEAAAAHFGFGSVAEMEDAAEAALEAAAAPGPEPEAEL